MTNLHDETEEARFEELIYLIKHDWQREDRVLKAAVHVLSLRVALADEGPHGPVLTTFGQQVWEKTQFFRAFKAGELEKEVSVPLLEQKDAQIADLKSVIANLELEAEEADQRLIAFKNGDDQ